MGTPTSRDQSSFVHLGISVLGFLCRNSNKSFKSWFVCFAFLILGQFMVVAQASTLDAATTLKILYHIAASKGHTVLLNDSQGISQIPRIRFDCGDGSLENFHIADLNGDNLKDLLYNGPCNTTPQTAAFIFNGIGYKKAFDVAGATLSLYQTEEQTSIYTYNPSNECIGTDRVGCYQIGRKGELIGYYTMHWWPEDTLLDLQPFSHTFLRGIVREGHVVDDTLRLEPCFGDTVVGNRIYEIPDIAHAWLLNSLMDWQQVLVAHGDSNYRIAWIQNQFQNMHPNAILIQRFYEGFQQKNHLQMGECYADSATFQDPVFTLKNGKEARAMWQMLCQNGKDLRVTFRDVQADDKQGSAHWEADYSFGPKGRKVHNVIEAKFEFKDGKIIMHRDKFKFYKWTRMALGATGTFMGWTPLVKNKVRSGAMSGLKKFMADKPEYR